MAGPHGLAGSISPRNGRAVPGELGELGELCIDSVVFGIVEVGDVEWREWKARYIVV